MRLVLWALAPGLALQCYWFGVGTLFNLGLAVGIALAADAALARFRGLDPSAAIRDCTALVTAALIALALPPQVPWYVLAIACVTALGLGKHAYGGTGNNLFNPAMVGYAVVLVSFPGELAWPPAVSLATDALTGPTLLESFKHRGAQTVAEAWQATAGFGAVGGLGMEWLNLGYLGGGIVLVAKRIVDWRIPAALLAAMGTIALLGYDAGSSISTGSPAMHAFAGATMLGAFFIATDPVTCPASARARLAFGALVGIVIMTIRLWGGFPDGVAFAVLVGNAATPLLDRYIGGPAPDPEVATR